MSTTINQNTADYSNSDERSKAEALENIEHSNEFKRLRNTKLKFIVPATIFFLVYYFALPVLVGFFGVNADGTPGFMDTRIAPGLSIAYLFALSQFIMAWVLAFIYLLAFAPKMDKIIQSIVSTVKHNKGGK